MDKQTEYNHSLTQEAFSDRFCRARSAHILYDAQRKVLGSVSKKGVFDLNGKQIAALSAQQRREDENGKTVHEATYASEARTFKLSCDDLYSVGAGAPVWVGRIARNKRNAARIALLSVIAAFLAATVVLLSLINLPIGEVERPVIDIRDNQGSWEAQDVIAVFDSSLRPGSAGLYDFVLRNPHQVEMVYEFTIEPKYEGADIDYFPIQFRLRMNNVLLESDEWRTVDRLRFSQLLILGETMQSFTLEWRWAFEDGNDANDTLLGADGGKISMVLHLTAQAR